MPRETADGWDEYSVKAEKHLHVKNDRGSEWGEQPVPP